MRAPRRTAAEWRRTAAGFTVIELVVTLAVTGILAGMLFTLAQVGESVQRSGWRRADLEGTRRNVESTLRLSLGRASRSVSAPNFGPVRVGVTGTDGAERDTLVVVAPTGPAFRVASRPCVSGAADCVALLDDRTAELEAGDLLALGSAATGYRVVQVRGEPRTFTAACGADCPGELVCPIDVGVAAPYLSVQLGEVAGGGSTTASCEEAVMPGGARCSETRVAMPARPRTTTACQARGPTVVFTAVSFRDRSTVVGLPDLPSWSRLSGGGSPGVAAIPVEALRFYLHEERGELALRRERNLTAAGDWSRRTRVAGPVAALRVETMHEGAAGWQRGDGVVPGALGIGGAYRVERTVASGAGTTGYEHTRGLHTVVGVRVRADVVSRGEDGTERVTPVWVVESLHRAARGGSREEVE